MSDVRMRAGAALAAGGGLVGVVVLWPWWAVDGGGVAATAWLPGIVWLTAVGAVLVLAGLPATRPTRAQRAALAALAGLAAWALLSALWADDAGTALLGGLRLVLATLALALPLLRPPRTPGALAAGAAVLVLAGVAALTVGLVQAAGGGAALDDGRLTAPAGYANATAALLAAAGLTAVGLAAGGGDRLRRSGPAVAMVAGAGAAGGVLIAGAVLAQSRSSAFAAAAGVAVLLAASPARARVLVVLLAIAAGVAVGWEALTDVRRLALAGDPAGAITGALWALGLTGVLGTGAAVLAARVVPATSPPPRVPRRALVAGGVALLVLLALPPTRSWVGDRWGSLRTADYTTLEASPTRFTGDLGSDRTDYWRVALDLAGERPLTGVGAEGFGAAYLLDRRSAQTPQYAHGAPWEAMATLGLPGLALLLVLGGALVAGLAHAVTRGDPAARGARVAAVAGPVVIGVHALGDWTTAFAVLTVPALALTGAAWGHATQGRDRRPAGRRGPALAGLAVATVLVGPLWLAARYEERGVARQARQPAAAIADLRSAARLNPLAARPLVSATGIAALAGRMPDARAAADDALARDPHAWYPRLVRGVLTGDPGDLREAVARNPRTPAVRTAVRAARAGRPPDLAALTAELARRP